MQLQLDGISKQVGADTHIYPLSLSLVPGKINVLLGQTRAGKTTLMRLMAGLDKPSSGRILMPTAPMSPACSVRQAQACRWSISSSSTTRTFTVFENIASPLRQAGQLGQGRDRAARSQETVADKCCASRSLLQASTRLELSGGQQQRTAMARALVKDADAGTVRRAAGEPRLQAARRAACRR